MYMLWFNFILGLNFLFFCFRLIIMLLSYITIPKNKKIEFEPRINRGYYMAVRRYKISLRVLKNIS